MQTELFWNTCLKSFEIMLPPQQYNSWIKPLKLLNEDGKFILVAPNTFTLKILQERFFSGNKPSGKAGLYGRSAI